jgi:hypothetical protein
MRKKGVLLLLILILTSSVLMAQQPAKPQKLFSPYTAETFCEIGCDLYTAPDANAADHQIAWVLLSAAADLDEKGRYLLPELIKLMARFPDQIYSRQMYTCLTGYVDENPDLEVAGLAVRYLLESLDARELREALLDNLLKQLGPKNPAFASELATQLALLAAEKTDFDTARSLLARAYQNNPYNKLAFAKFDELSPQPLPPVVYIRHLRLAMRENPLALDNSLKFARSAESLGLYELAAEAYEYSADLYSYLHPSRVLPASIYLPWAVSCYNAQGRQQKCLEIAAKHTGGGQPDVLLQAIAAQAALALGHKTKAEELLGAVDSAAALALTANPALPATEAEKFAWFYCFASPEPEKALLWANKAYSGAPDTPGTMATLAYSLVLNQQYDLAAPLAESLADKNQIAALIMGIIELNRENKTKALELLKSAVALDPGSLEAQYASKLLQQNGSDYIFTVEPSTILETLKDEFGSSILPKFAPLGKTLSVKLTADSPAGFAYGSKTKGTLTIYNNSSEPLVVSDDGLLKGYIRVDAEISGDVQAKIPNLLVQRVRPGTPIEPGRAASFDLRLVCGRLKQILRQSPQAGLQIKFVAYIDPVTPADGNVRSAIADIPLATLAIERSPVNLTARYLQDRLDYVAKGNQSQKIKSATLCAGLLLEQQAMAKGLFNYKFVLQQPALLRSALVRSLADQDWAVKVQTTAAIMGLPLDYELTDALAANLYAQDWPARLMAILVLAKSQGSSFKRVLDSVAKSDESPHVRQMAIALGADVPPQEPPAAPPADSDSASREPAAKQKP